MKEAVDIAASLIGCVALGVALAWCRQQGLLSDEGLAYAGLKLGQNVLTSGTGGVFPAGVLIGQVKEFQARELDGHASIIPAVDFTKLEDVFVVIGKSK